MSNDTEICGIESTVAPGKFCQRPAHHTHGVHVFSGMPHDGQREENLHDLNAMSLVTKERFRHILLGYDAKHDDEHTLEHFRAFIAERAAQIGSVGSLSQQVTLLTEIAALSVAAIEKIQRMEKRGQQ